MTILRFSVPAALTPVLIVTSLRVRFCMVHIKQRPSPQQVVLTRPRSNLDHFVVPRGTQREAAVLGRCERSVTGTALPAAALAAPYAAPYAANCASTCAGAIRRREQEAAGVGVASGLDLLQSTRSGGHHRTAHMIAPCRAIKSAGLILRRWGPHRAEYFVPVRFRLKKLTYIFHWQL